jgi:hypothetical protein
MAGLQAKRFNTAGTCAPSENYMLPALDRNRYIGKLIENEQYFVIHAPRQSGKTTLVAALVDKINSDGKHYAFACPLGNVRQADGFAARRFRRRHCRTDGNGSFPYSRRRP